MLALFLTLQLQAARPLPTAIREVTLYANAALVRRSGTLPGAGEFVVEGLPACIDPDNVRVRCTGGDVLDVETRERLQPATSNERLQALRDALKALGREQQLAQDEAAGLKGQALHLEQMRASEEAAHAREVASGRANVEAWTANYEFLARKTVEVSHAQRENAWKQEELAARAAAAQKALGEAQAQGARKVFDVHVNVEARAEAALDVEYLTSNTGWEPAYDLRARKTLDKVELTYRARVWQQTGEDWSEVALALSTARPQIGAQGPEPLPQWLTLRMPGEALDREPPASAAPAERAKLVDKDAGSLEAPLNPNMRFVATVESQGLSVRFQLPKPATIQSRPEPTSLLVGDAQLDIQAERHCVPALDSTVWLRGKARNSSPWTLLPGSAAVFFGADYLGPAQIGTVQPGQELTLHLGADPALSVKREQIEDQSKGPGFLSNRASEVKSWRLHLENHGALGARRAHRGRALAELAAGVGPRALEAGARGARDPHLDAQGPGGGEGPGPRLAAHDHVPEGDAHRGRLARLTRGRARRSRRSTARRPAPRRRTGRRRGTRSGSCVPRRARAGRPAPPSAGRAGGRPRPARWPRPAARSWCRAA
jgi:uncharacterized protein (TIGR02231 family)